MPCSSDRSSMRAWRAGALGRPQSVRHRPRARNVRPRQLPGRQAGHGVRVSRYLGLVLAAAGGRVQVVMARRAKGHAALRANVAIHSALHAPSYPEGGRSVTCGARRFLCWCVPASEAAAVVRPPAGEIRGGAHVKLLPRTVQPDPRNAAANSVRASFLRLFCPFCAHPACAWCAGVLRACKPGSVRCRRPVKPGSDAKLDGEPAPNNGCAHAGSLRFRVAARTIVRPGI